MPLTDWLEELFACGDAIAWSQKYRTLPRAWIECPRGDWLIWLAAYRAGERGWPSRKEVMSAVCDCVDESIRVVGKDDHETKKALKVMRAWTEGKAKINAVKNTKEAWYERNRGVISWLKSCIVEDRPVDASLAVEHVAKVIAQRLPCTGRDEDIKIRALRKLATIVRRKLKPGPWPGGKGDK